MDRVGGHAPDKIFPWTSPTMPRYNGVRLRPEWKSWVTEIQIPNTKRRLWLGSYPTAEMAARAYDAAVVRLKGPSDPKLNFPNSLISPDVVQSCTDLEGVKAIAKAAAYAIDSSSVPALQAARTPDSDYTHDRTPLVTPPELECSIGRRSSLIDEDFIFNHGDLILFDSVQGIDDHIHNAGEGFFNINEIRPHPHGAEEDDHLWEWGLLAMNETFGNPFGPSWASSDGVLGLGKGKY